MGVKGLKRREKKRKQTFQMFNEGNFVLWSSIWTRKTSIHLGKKTILYSRPFFLHGSCTTVKASNFVILLGENIFFLRIFLRAPHHFFWYWNLCSTGLGIAQSHFGLGHYLGLENSFFCWVTKLGDRHLISSPSEVFQFTMRALNRGC